MVNIKIPYKWKPRKYQMKLWNYLENGGKRAVAVWHRRAGKDSLSLNWTAVAAMQRVGVYWHMLPLQTQARKVVWDAIDKQGRRVIDQVFPKALRKSANAQEMKIELLNGSIWQCVGSDGYNSLVGANPVGVVFSEYSIADPAAWDFIRPILAENDGWALFIYTPRGRNHGLTLFETAEAAEGWFAQKLVVSETRAIPQSAVEAERRAGMDESVIQQEFYCSFDAALKGSYYGALLNELENNGRIGSVPYDPALPVTTAWDLGIGDSTAIWFFQTNGAEVFVIDYYEASGVGLDHYVRELKSKPYVYTDDNIFPHDIGVHELSSGKSRLDLLAGLGVRGRVLPRVSVDSGIAAVRLLLPRCRFDKEKCAKGLEALRQYQRAWDDQRKDFQPKPLHDWTSHAADAFRYLACGIKEKRNKQERPFSQTQAAYRDYDPLG
ncbi:MAG: hypothetical protein IJ752_05290 [Alphaproteobacteria bacterium]|nr:hypothetical protein [Alphaproteobacteria bacterium]